MHEEVLEGLVHVGMIPEREGADCFRPPVIDETEQVLLHLVADHRTEMRGVQVVLDEASLRAPFMKSRTRHLPAIGQALEIRV